MRDGYQLLVDTPWDGQQFDFFHRPAFYELYRGEFTASHAYQLSDSCGRVVGAIHFNDTGEGEFRSPGRGSYGGFQLASGLPGWALDEFVADVEQSLRSLGARSLVVVDPPFAYDPAAQARAFNTLLRSGFGINRHELSHALEVTSAPFVERVDRGNRKRLAKARAHGLRAALLQRHDLESAYRVIEQNRHARDIPLTMTWEAVRELGTRFPDEVMPFGVFDGEQRLLAASICIAVSTRILYVFYWGDVPGVQELSPVTLLAEQIYRHCQSSGFALMDVGVSTVNGVPNEGLIRYKTNLGCTPSLKLEYRKSLA